MDIANNKPNIVLISLDCVRPDFLGCYGCGAVRTPHLDRMAARGVVFDQAVSQAPNTWVSHAGILTGCYPPLHGLRSAYDGILEEVPTLAEILKGCGYATAGFGKFHFVPHCVEEAFPVGAYGFDVWAKFEEP